jgi:Zn finger protein HypA/HybF involved in hydrogenase expression
MTVPGEAVSVRCRDCRAEFFVVGEPITCPHCGSDDVAGEHAVRVEPI